MRIYSRFSAYILCVIKRTSINLDLELVAEARGIFGTKNTTDTVHTALREAVRRERLKRASRRCASTTCLVAGGTTSNVKRTRPDADDS